MAGKWFCYFEDCHSKALSETTDEEEMNAYLHYLTGSVFTKN